MIFKLFLVGLAIQKIKIKKIKKVIAVTRKTGSEFSVFQTNFQTTVLRLIFRSNFYSTFGLCMLMPVVYRQHKARRG